MLQEGLDFSATGGPVGMVEVVEHFKAWNGDGDFGKWSVDQVAGEHFCNYCKSTFTCLQVILSFVILRPDKQLCDLPESNGLWAR